MKNLLLNIDEKVIDFAKQNFVLIARLAFFLIFFWFGLLKALGLSPASELVENLFNATFLSSLLPFEAFYILFAYFEMVIGFMFLFPKLTRLAFVVFIAHLVMTTMPLAMLPREVWAAPFAPTLEGQYIVKNIALLALALGILASLRPTEQRV